MLHGSVLQSHSMVRFPMETPLPGNKPHMRSGFVIRERFFMNNWETVALHRKWISLQRKSAMTKASDATLTSCRETGLGGNQCVQFPLMFLAYTEWSMLQNDIAQDPKTYGATFCPIILGSDKTTVSVATGQNEYYPLYMSNGLVHNNL